MLEISETLFLVLSKHFFNDWWDAALRCAVISAVMSTLSCLLLIAANGLVEGLGLLFRPTKPPQGAGLWCHRLAVLVVALVSLCLAANPHLTIMESVAFPWCGLGGALGPVVVMSLYWQRMTAQGAMAGILSGGGFVLLWEAATKLGMQALHHQNLLPGFSLLPAFLIAAAAIVVVSYATPSPTDKVLAQFEAFRQL